MDGGALQRKKGQNGGPSYHAVPVDPFAPLARNPIAVVSLIAGFCAIWVIINVSEREAIHTGNNGGNLQGSYTTTGNDIQARSAGDLMRKRILSVCGPELCDTNRPVVRLPKKYDFGYFGLTTSRVNCQALFESTLLDEPGNFPDGKSPPINAIPPELMPDFQMNGRVQISPWYINEIYLGSEALNPTWEKEQIEDWKQRALNGQFNFGNYQEIDQSTLFDALKNVARVQGQSVLVIGSESPWVEALCLAAGARKVSTLEYGSVTSTHPQVIVYTPDKFRMAFLQGQLEKFDAVVSYSSLEHSGLGRYGDALNPWGDIMNVARAWCVTKQGGTMTLGVSSAPQGGDRVWFNAGRIYGPERWPYMATNWARMNYTSGWEHHPEIWDKALHWKANNNSPQGWHQYLNQSSLVFRRTGPRGSPHELQDLDSLLV